jgi:hypothetical protein
MNMALTIPSTKLKFAKIGSSLASVAMVPSVSSLMAQKMCLYLQVSRSMSPFSKEFPASTNQKSASLFSNKITAHMALVVFLDMKSAPW